MEVDQIETVLFFLLEGFPPNQRGAVWTVRRRLYLCQFLSGNGEEHLGHFDLALHLAFVDAIEREAVCPHDGNGQFWSDARR